VSNKNKKTETENSERGGVKPAGSAGPAPKAADPAEPASATAHGRNVFDLSREEIERLFRYTEGRPPVPRLDDREAWDTVASRAETADMLADLPWDGREEVPVIRARDWRAFTLSGDRQEFDRRYAFRRRRVVELTIAYAIHQTPDIVPLIEDYLWAICEETEWTLSAHVHNNITTDFPSADISLVDMAAPRTVIALAEAVFILDGVIHPEVAERVRSEVERRIIREYYHRRDLYWMHWSCNWNAAGHAGVMAAAVYFVREPAPLAYIVHKILQHLPNFLGGFDEDGGTSEGINTWNVGVGHYTIAAQLLEARSDGRMNLMTGARGMPEIARFPQRVRLSDNQYVTFSDAPQRFYFSPFIMYYMNRQLGADLPVVRDPVLKEYTYLLRNLLVPEEMISETPAASPKHVFFRGLGWMISRDAPRDDPADESGLVLAVKGGHNDENHNHNDGGSFLVHYRGESLLVDMGKDLFTRQMFSGDRYSILCCRSRGHSVPLINDTEQGAGRAFEARMLDYELGKIDRVLYDLARLYPPSAGIAGLTREMRFERSDGAASTTGDGVDSPEARIRLLDEVTLEQAGVYEERFWSFRRPQEVDGDICISGRDGGLRLEAAASFAATAPTAPAPAITRVEEAIQGRDAYLIQYRFENVKQLSFALTVYPDPHLSAAPAGEPDGDSEDGGSKPESREVT